jgi:hypothetical protein
VFFFAAMVKSSIFNVVRRREELAALARWTGWTDEFDLFEYTLTHLTSGFGSGCDRGAELGSRRGPSFLRFFPN